MMINRYGFLSTLIQAFWLVVFLLLTPFLIAQNQKSVEPLVLENAGKSIENIIEFTIPKRDFRRIKKIDNKKIYLQDIDVVLNGEKQLAQEIHTRGQTSHGFRRKSYAITFDKKVKFLRSGEIVKLKHVDALNLVWDKYYFGNRLAFGLMEKVALSRLFHSYGEVKINSRSEGIYMFIERPQDWALKKTNSPFIIRRGYDHRVDKLKTVDRLDSNAFKRYVDDYKKIYSLIENREGKELYEKLSALLDMEMYMKWMAFNFLFQNGDYTDELYFYVDPVEDRFKLIPWDYDDIFASEPHEGSAVRDSLLIDKLIYSSEDLLDLKIANDNYLYQKYTEQLQLLVNQLTPGLIKEELEETYAELLPYYADKKILAMNKHDWFNDASLEKLANELQYIFEKLIKTRSQILSELKK